MLEKIKKIDNKMIMDLEGTTLAKFVDQMGTPNFDAAMQAFTFSTAGLYSPQIGAGFFDLPSDAALNTPALIASLEKFDFVKPEPNQGENQKLFIFEKFFKIQ